MRKATVGILTLVTVLGAGVAHAASPGFCQGYADGAAQQYQRMRATPDCARPPSNLWHTDRGLHYSWCLSAPASAVRAEARKRDLVISACDPSYGD